MLRTETIERGTLELLSTLMRDKKLKSFNLVGGTALSLYMGHRKSIDLDLFSQQSFDVNELEKHLIYTYGFQSDDSKKSSEATLIGLINNIKVDCIRYDYPFAEPVKEYNGIRICSATDIAAMKLTAIAHNGTRLKDFVDVAFLSGIMPLTDMLNAFEKKYPNTNKMAAIKGLTYFEDIDFSVKIDLINGMYNWRKIEKRLNEMIKYPDKLFSPCSM